MRLGPLLALAAMAGAFFATAAHPGHSSSQRNWTQTLEASCHIGHVFSLACCKHAPPSPPPSPRRLKLTFFIATRNDHYGGNPSAARSAAAVASVAWGLDVYDLMHDAE